MNEILALLALQIAELREQRDRARAELQQARARIQELEPIRSKSNDRVQ